MKQTLNGIDYLVVGEAVNLVVNKIIAARRVNVAFATIDARELPEYNDREIQKFFMTLKNMGLEVKPGARDDQFIVMIPKLGSYDPSLCA